MNNFNSFDYRKEIDGLRALAVIPVVLFHAGFDIFSGGFVGVDIFFVISGYLITSLILQEKINDRFSLVNFYERRARRILPALFLVVIVTIPFAFLVMSPLALKEFSNSLISIPLFLSNFQFWSESGYFATAAEEKPLLHTWSLAVEEQFYLLFPFLLFFLKKDLNKIFTVVFLLTILSFFYANLTSFNNFKLSFYILPSRFWEISLGSLLALIIFNGKKIYTNNLLNYISPKIGLSLIIFSVFLFDKNTLHPSIITLVPLLGVILIILFSNKDEFITKILSSKLILG